MSPFNQAHHERLLQGLEISELMLSRVLDDNDVFRIDPQYFSDGALHVIASLHALHSPALSELATITDGIHASLPFVTDGAVKVLSAQHPKDNFIDAGDFGMITRAEHDANPRTALRANDVLLSTVGTIGNAATVTHDILPANSDRHIGIIRLRAESPSPFYVSTFLVSEYGRVQSLRESTGNVQLNLFISKIGRILIPRFSEGFESLVTAVARHGYAQRLRARRTLHATEQTLLRALGLANWQPLEPQSYVRSSSDAFAAGRFDAEYFAPRVKSLMDRLGQDNTTIGDMAAARHQKYHAADIGTFDYIEIGSLTADGSVTAETLDVKEAPSRATQHVQAGDVITSTVRPIRRLSALVTDTQDGAVCSSGLVVLDPQKVSGAALLTYLRLPVICELMDVHTTATMYPAISEADLLALPFPKIANDVDQDIQNRVRQAAFQRDVANSLLDAAKRAVEIAIENSEAQALAFLEEAKQQQEATPHG